MIKDGIPLQLETDYNKRFIMEERFDKIQNLNRVSLGKTISYLLRHNPENLEMDKKGWVNVSDLLNKLEISRIILDDIVFTNDKRRYSYSIDGTKIRANQGHSIDVDIDLIQDIPPSKLYHGTSPGSVYFIMRNGIMKMTRNFVHLSNDINTAYDVGKRHCNGDEEPVILEIYTHQMVKDNVKFYLSENCVWLTNYVHNKYIKIRT